MNSGFGGDGGKKMLDFVNKRQQEAVVVAVQRIPNVKAYLLCYSPVFGDFNINLPKEVMFDDYQRGDILLVEQKVNSDEYVIKANRTRQQIKLDGVDKIMKNFSQFEREAIMNWCHTNIYTQQR